MARLHVDGRVMWEANMWFRRIGALTMLAAVASVGAGCAPSCSDYERESNTVSGVVFAIPSAGSVDAGTDDALSVTVGYLEGDDKVPLRDAGLEDAGGLSWATLVGDSNQASATVSDAGTLEDWLAQLAEQPCAGACATLLYLVQPSNLGPSPNPTVTSCSPPTLQGAKIAFQCSWYWTTVTSYGGDYDNCMP